MLPLTKTTSFSLSTEPLAIDDAKLATSIRPTAPLPSSCSIRGLALHLHSRRTFTADKLEEGLQFYTMAANILERFSTWRRSQPSCVFCFSSINMGHIYRNLL
jgi:hypothetical protein